MQTKNQPGKKYNSKHVELKRIKNTAKQMLTDLGENYEGSE